MSEFLVTQSENFLKKIQQKPIIAESIEDFDSFINIYSHLKENLIKLQNMRNEMEIRGFKTPYSSLKRYGKPNLNNPDIVPDDVYDQSRHAQYFRIKASSKKNLLDQVKSAIASHKIAIGHLEEFSIITCENCGQKYTKNTLDEIINYDEEYTVTNIKCYCESQEFKFKSNPKGICRPEIIKYLPLGGEYLLKRSQLKNYSIEGYRTIINTIKQEKRGKVKSVTVIAKIKDEKTGKWNRKKINIDYADENSYELEVRKRYGSKARIELLQFHHKKPSLINDKYVQNALAIAYLHYAENIVNKNIDEIIPKQIHNMKKMDKYKIIISESRKDASRLARGTQEREELEEELIQIRLKKEKLLTKEGKLDRELKEDLKKEENIQKHFYIETPHTIILWDIFKYYLTTSENKRNNYAGPFPNLRPTLDSNQIKVFQNNFPRDIIKLLTDNGENITYINNMKETVQYKFELENKRKKLHLKSNHALCGAVALNNKSNISVEKSASLLNLYPEAVSNEKINLHKIEKPSTKKAKKFLDLINK